VRQVDNRDVAQLLNEIADLLDLQGVAFKPVAYRRAARNIEDMDQPVADVVAKGALRDIPGVGDAIAKKVEEYVQTGKLPYLEKLRSEVPLGLIELLKVPDIGPKTAIVLHRDLGITNLQELREAAENHRLRGHKGFGEKTEEKILQGINMLQAKGERMLLGDALPIAEGIVEYLRANASVEKISIGGSLRRGKETIGDIDILVGDNNPARVMDSFTGHPFVQTVLMKGPTKSSVLLQKGIQVDIRAVETGSWGAALQYFTGSKEHNVATRKIGVDMGLKLNEYGLFERDSGRKVAGATEEEVYRALGLTYIEPELREDGGEIEAAREGRLPRILEHSSIRGDFHMHTDWSDGGNRIEDMAARAVSKNYEFIGITDHSQSLKIAGGLTPDRLRKQIDAVRKAEDALGGRIRLLSGTEADIKADGSLDFPRPLLKDLDLVIASVHSRFKMPKDEMTKRVVAAIESGYMDILGHPTGRLIGRRNPYEIDMEKVLDAAAESRVAMELNSWKDRLDLADGHCRMAKAARVKVAIGTDAHHVDELDFMRLGVITARRGWLEAGDVLNTMSGKDIVKHLRGRRP
jgi:DNA polymerase (family 10)